MNYDLYLTNLVKELYNEEKSESTINKYMKDTRDFISFLGNHDIDKEIVIEYKKHLSEEYKPATVNAKIVAINRFLKFINKNDCIIKMLKIQKQVYLKEEKELTVDEYKRLTEAAKDTRIGLIIKTICSTGIRISELEYITVEAITSGKAEVSLKGKNRIIFIPSTLRDILTKYIDDNNIKAGPIFITKSGKPLNRSNIWKEMKKLCEKANVSKDKVFPHNLRHLFARMFYEEEKDIVRLADVLGHSSINTTRIYTMESGKKHLEVLEKVSKLFIDETEYPFCSYPRMKLCY